MSDEPRMIVEPLTLAHVQDFVSRPIRQDDVDEWVDGLGGHPRDLLPQAYRADQYGRALSIIGVGVVLIWGCSVDGDVGTIWLVASDFDLSLAPLIHREFGIEEMPKLHQLASFLQAFPSSKNTTHIKWLEHFGFKKTRTLRFSASSVPFHRYVRRAARVL